LKAQRPTRRRYLLYGVSASLVVIVAGLSVVVALGVYNVAASAKHFSITDRLIKFALHRSISLHSRGIEAPMTESEGAVELGARHFAARCAPCHGAPGTPRNPVATSMYPAPPKLNDAVAGWRDIELAWIVENGLKFTGMPHWPGRGRLDEVWPVLAFLRKLPDMDEREFAHISRAPRRSPTNAAIAACIGCHGDGYTGSIDDSVPLIQGQSVEYLTRALEDYAADRRQSGFMEPVAAALSAEDRKRAALAYSKMPRPVLASESSVPTESLASGSKLVNLGSQDQSIAACIVCHGDIRSEHFPSLEGLTSDYIETQLKLFRSGVRGKTQFGHIMQSIARQLNTEQVEAVAAYLGAASVPDPSRKVSQ
jgi:cytochrome c553